MQTPEAELEQLKDLMDKKKKKVQKACKVVSQARVKEIKAVQSGKQICRRAGKGPKEKTKQAN